VLTKLSISPNPRVLRLMTVNCCVIYWATMPEVPIPVTTFLCLLLCGAFRLRCDDVSFTHRVYVPNAAQIELRPDCPRLQRNKHDLSEQVRARLSKRCNGGSTTESAAECGGQQGCPPAVAPRSVVHSGRNAEPTRIPPRRLPLSSDSLVVPALLPGRCRIAP
jgi:hypothetical protein